MTDAERDKRLLLLLQATERAEGAAKRSRNFDEVRDLERLVEACYETIRELGSPRLQGLIRFR